MLPPTTTTAQGALLVLAIAVPTLGVLAAVVLGARAAQRLAFVVLAGNAALALAITAALAGGEVPTYVLGAVAPPLGVALRADGLAATMLLATAAVSWAVALYARADFPTPAGAPDARAPFTFWTLLMAVQAALTVVWLSGDLFTLYVALELLTFAAVPLVCLDGRADTLRAALRYLLFALAGSLLYLTGTALLYGAWGTLDIALLGQRTHAGAGTVTLVALALMTAGLLAKTALFPLHLWLPPAHAGAPAPASALLSALVVKGSWFIVLRLWLDALPGAISPAAAQTIGALGAAAIVFGSLVALQQARLKLMVAYSTVGQIGYLFLMLPLLLGVEAARTTGGAALTGGVLQAVSHATAKAAMFMAAGLVYAAAGHDRVADLKGLARALPLTVAAFALGGIALIGLPPAGGFVAKWLLLARAWDTGQWWWIVVLAIGGLLTAAYLAKVLNVAFDRSADASVFTPVARGRQAIVLALATLSMLLGLAALAPVDLVGLGRMPLGLAR